MNKLLQQHWLCMLCILTSFWVLLTPKTFFAIFFFLHLIRSQNRNTIRCVLDIGSLLLKDGWHPKDDQLLRSHPILPFWVNFSYLCWYATFFNAFLILYTKNDKKWERRMEKGKIGYPSQWAEQCLGVDQLLESISNGWKCVFNDFLCEYAWSQNNDWKCHLNIFWSAFGCVQNPKAVWNTQHL